MKRSWLGDALIGLPLTGYVLASYFLGSAFPGGHLLETLELKAYDMRAMLRQNLDPSSDIAIIAIDDDSIARLGRWPWPRTRIAQMLDLLVKAKPKVIGLDILYTEPERNPAMDELGSLQARYEQLVKGRKIIERGTHFAAELSSASARLDTDMRLLASLAATPNVVLPMYFTTGGLAAGKVEEPPQALAKSALTLRVVPQANPAPLVEGRKAAYPIAPFLGAAAGVGHVNIYPDVDGVVRREVPAIKYGERFYPSYALDLVLRSLDLSADSVRVTPTQSIEIANTRIPLDDNQSMLVTFNGPDHTFRYYSFYEVLEGKVPLDVFKDKIVLLGPSAPGVATLYVTPVAHNLPSVEFIANIIENILGRRFLVRPEWADRAELGLILFAGLFILLILPRLRALGGAAWTTLITAAIIGSGTYLFKEKGEWIKIIYPCFVLVAGYLIVVTKRFFATEKGKELVEASAVETNKMLGLSFQGQGMLDLAFEKFRLCPVDENMKETLYNLGLDFERKRQYAKAVSVYQYIAVKEPAYRDIADKIKTLKAAAQGAVFGGIGPKAQESTLLITEGASRPKLGRYEIVKELGRGAMGIVYLGSDPKINRQVAIKTLMLEEGATTEETKEIKERYFREAQSAGTLNHPGIVRIYDAGEEQDVCYIAMELLDGEDLARFTTKRSLLEPAVAMDYIARVAEALDYAHSKGIIHRDVKPGNIMLLKDGSIRIADFGVARIASSSKTATGTVVGTPSYMSPEQVAGKKVDGRSDLFSLGVCLFEFLTGERPFKGGESMGTLLFQITNEPEPEPCAIRPDLPRCVSRVIHKALKKNPEERYQRGSEMAAEIRSCIEIVKKGPTQDLAAPVEKQEPAKEGAAEPTFPMTPEEIARTIVMPAQAVPPRPEAKAAAQGSTTDEIEAADIENTLRLADLESVMPQVAPDSLSPSDMLSKTLPPESGEPPQDREPKP